MVINKNKNKIEVVIISLINTVQIGSVLQYFFIILLAAKMVFVSLTSWGALFQAFPVLMWKLSSPIFVLE